MASVDELKDRFTRLCDNEALAHGYILYGASLKRQYAFARSLATYIERGTFEEETKPLLDARFIDAPVKSHGIDVARSITEFLYLEPVISPKRTLVINGAQHLTQQAQNALLKIAEEPPQHALVFLIARDLGVFLPPLLSRFQALYMSGERMDGEIDDELHASSLAQVKRFLTANTKGRQDLIKQMVTDEKETPGIIDSFMTLLMEELNKDPERNYKALKELLKRYAAMQQYSVNKRVQLETIIPFL